MSTELKNIFEAITPDNIKNIQIIKDSMDIFIQILEENSKESIDIFNSFKNESIREELYRVYLDDLYNILKSVQTNEKIIKHITDYNEALGLQFYDVEKIQKITEYITDLDRGDEFFLSLRTFKESKGTEKAIKFAHDLIAILFGLPIEDSPFELETIDKFQFTVKGALPGIVYDEVVRPLAHPLGFLYAYSQYILMNFVDYYPSETIDYDVVDLGVSCLLPSGETEFTDYKYYYDEFGNKIEVTTGGGDPILVDPSEYTITYDYDSYSFLSSQILDPGGSLTLNDYSSTIYEDRYIVNSSNENAYVYDWNPSTETFEYNFTIPSPSIGDPASNPGASILDHYVTSLSLNQNRLALGMDSLALSTSSVSNKDGFAYILDLNETTGEYDLVASIPAPELAPNGTGIRFGAGIAVDQTRLVVGATMNSAFYAGKAFVYLWNQSTGEYDFAHDIIPSNSGGGLEFGRSIDMWDDYLVIGSYLTRNPDFGNIEMGGVFVYKWNPTFLEYEEIQIIYPHDYLDGTETQDRYGANVSIDNGILLVGHTNNDDQGASEGRVELLKLNTTTDQFEFVELIYSNATAGSGYGHSVSHHGNKGVISGTPWSGADPQILLLGYTETITGLPAEAVEVNSFESITYTNEYLEFTIPDPFFPLTVPETGFTDFAMYGDYAIFGEGDDIGGSVKVWKWNAGISNYDYAGTLPLLPAPLYSANTSYGCSVGLWGNRIVVGAYRLDPHNEVPSVEYGGVHIFDVDYSGPTPTYTYVDSIFGDFNDGAQRFGHGLDVYEDILVVGATEENATTEGRAYVYRWNNSTSQYDEIQILTPHTSSNHYEFGKDISVYGDYIVISSSTGGNLNQGVVFTYKLNATSGLYENHQEIIRPGNTITLDNDEANDNFGSAVSLNGSLLLIGHSHNDTNGVDDSGIVYAYDLTTTGSFEYNQTVLNPGELFGLDQPKYFSTAIAHYGDRAIMGGTETYALLYDLSFQRAWYIFPEGGTGFTEYQERTVVSYVEATEVNVNPHDETGEEQITDIRIVRFDDGTYLKQVSFPNGESIVYFIQEGNPEVILETYGNGETHEGQAQCSILFNREETFNPERVEDTDAEYLDDRSTAEYFSRLYEVTNPYDPNNIGQIGNELVSFDIGYNQNIDVNGNILLTPSPTGGRQENRFAPDWESDLKHLEGKFELNYEVYDGPTLIGVQPIKYTETVVPQYVSVERVLELNKFQEQNIGNEDYLAREHEIHNLIIGNDVQTIPVIDTTSLLYIGSGWDIGDGTLVGFAAISIQIEGDAYYLIGEFDHLSDLVNFDFGVYDSSGNLIPDGNRGALGL
jgi:hypothetical protein